MISTIEALCAGMPVVRLALGHVTSGRVRTDLGAFPDDLETEDGYPADARVDEIGCVSFRDADRWLREVMPEAVNAMPCGGADIERATDFLDRPVLRITVVTGGWSGIESVVDAVLDHPKMRMRLAEQYRGGKYVFEVPLR